MPPNPAPASAPPAGTQGQMVSLYLAHPPLSKPRPRATVQGRVYMPDRYRAWQQAIQVDVRQQYQGEPLTGPLEMTLIVYGPSRGLGDLEGYFGALADTLGGNRKAQTPGIVFDDDDQIVNLGATFQPAPEWQLAVFIREVEPLTYPKPPRKRRTKETPLSRQESR